MPIITLTTINTKELLAIHYKSYFNKRKKKDQTWKTGLFNGSKQQGQSRTSEFGSVMDLGGESLCGLLDRRISVSLISSSESLSSLSTSSTLSQLSVEPFWDPTSSSSAELESSEDSFPETWGSRCFFEEPLSLALLPSSRLGDVDISLCQLLMELLIYQWSQTLILPSFIFMGVFSN